MEHIHMHFSGSPRQIDKSNLQIPESDIFYNLYRFGNIWLKNI